MVCRLYSFVVPGISYKSVIWGCWLPVVVYQWRVVPVWVGQIFVHEECLFWGIRWDHVCIGMLCLDCSKCRLTEFTGEVIICDYIIRFIGPAIGPNKSKKLTRPKALAHNIRGKVWMKNNIHGFTDRHWLWSHVVFHSNFDAFFVCQRHKPCGFPGFVWTDCWGNKSWVLCNHFSGK